MATTNQKIGPSPTKPFGINLWALTTYMGYERLLVPKRTTYSKLTVGMIVSSNSASVTIIEQ